MKMKVKFIMQRETKGTVLYQEVNDRGQLEFQFHAIGHLYIRKAAFAPHSPYPQTLEVTVETPSTSGRSD